MERAILFPDLYTLRSRWASSMTTKSQSTLLMASSLARVKWYEQITTPVASVKGFRAPSFCRALKARASITSEGRKNLSPSSWAHCLRSVVGTMTNILRWRSAQSWLIISPASMVFPRPTSSANRAPRERGDRNANNAASIWCGFRSTVALRREWPSFSRLSEALRLVRA